MDNKKEQENLRREWNTKRIYIANAGSQCPACNTIISDMKTHQPFCWGMKRSGRDIREAKAPVSER